MNAEMLVLVFIRISDQFILRLGALNDALLEFADRFLFGLLGIFLRLLHAGGEADFFLVAFGEVVVLNHREIWRGCHREVVI